MNRPIPNGKEEILYQGKIFEVIRKPMKIGDKEVDFEIVKRSPGIRLIITKNNKILLTREFRTELNDYDYRLPGGKVFNTLKEYNEAEEDMLKYATEAAKKECIEETGLEAKKITLFQTAKAGATIEWDLFYFVVDDFEKAEQKLEPGEEIYPEWKSFDEIRKLISDNKIKEDRSIGVILRFLEC